LVPTAFLQPIDIEIYAANGTRINVLGWVKVQFSVMGVAATADLLVSDDVHEFMLGYDWLSKQGITWHFNDRTVTIRGQVVPLKERVSRIAVNRVYVRGHVGVALNEGGEDTDGAQPDARPDGGLKDEIRSDEKPSDADVPSGEGVQVNLTHLDPVIEFSSDAGNGNRTQRAVALSHQGRRESFRGKFGTKQGPLATPRRERGDTRPPCRKPPRRVQARSRRVPGTYSANDYADVLLRRLEEAFENARENLQTTANRMQDWYDKKVHVQTFGAGDEVYVLNLRLYPGKSPKWLRRYSDIATVVKKINPVTYAVRCDAWRQKERILHVDKLKLYVKAVGEAVGGVVGDV
jgi:hypothetical protein